MRKMVSVLLVAGLLLTLLPTGVWASDVEEGAAPTTNGNWTDENNYDVSWYTETIKENPNATEFTLNDEKDLAGLAAIGKGVATDGEGNKIEDDFAGKTVKLADNVTIDLSGKEWTYISGFKGTFDGNSDKGASITNLTMTSEDNRSGGLFGGTSGEIKNVKISNAYIKISDLGTNTRVGGIVTSVTGEKSMIDNCSFQGTIIVQPTTSVYSNGSCVGGIVAAAEDASVSGCSFSGIIQSETENTGGIIGLNTATKVTDCQNDGTVNSDRSLSYVGGIVGQDKTNSTISGCTNNGRVTGGDSSDVGGIIGLMYGCTISECSSSKQASVNGTGAAYLGGIVGRVYPNNNNTANIKDCANNGSVTSSETPSGTGTGGILGGIFSNNFPVSGNVTIETCSNTGSIMGNDETGASAGGILGHHRASSAALTLKQCYNTGTVASTQETGSSDTAGIGGIIGALGTNATSSMEDCYNTGTINAGELSVPAGGLLGRLYILNGATTGTSDFSIKNAYNVGTITGKTTGGIYGEWSDNATPKLENCSYWDGCGAAGQGDIKTSNAMTDNDDWSETLGLDKSVWTKTLNSGTTGYLPVLSANKQDPEPTLPRVKEDQGTLTINSPLANNNDEVLVDSLQTIQLTTSGGSAGGVVTWKITSGADIASIDANGLVTLKQGAVGRVDITATMAGGDAYNDAVANYSFRVVSEAIDEVVIQNLVAPAIGETVSNNIDVPKNAHYASLTPLGGNKVSWYVVPSDSAQPAGNQFESGKQYQASLRLKADDHYYYDSGVNVVLEGIKSEAIENIVSHPSGDNLIILITFKTTTHTHSWSGAWSGDATHHWYKCEKDGCPMIGKDYAQHTDEDGDGICDVCERTIGYIITFDANGGTCDVAERQTTLDGTLSTLPTATREGYTFRGWFTAASGGEQVTTATVFDANTTLYAQWEKMPEPPYSGKYNYPVTVTDTDNGTVLLDKADEWVTGGETVTFSIAPDEAYLLESLTITDKNGKEITVKDNGDGTYTFTMPESAVTITATFAEDPDWEPTPEPGEEWPFVDVSEGDWFYDPVAWAYEQGLMTGTSATTFEPNISTTRGMIVAILHRLEDSPVVNYAMTFDDVADGDWYAEAVRWAASEGIVAGYSDAQFGPNDPITREQMAAILYNYAEWKGYDVSARADLSGYSDQPSAWAVEVMQWANAEDLINGTTAITLDPQGNATRAQVAAILQRFLEN